MRKKKDQSVIRRFRSSYLTSVVSITMVLFLLGLLGLLVLNARKLSDYVRENIGFSVILKEGVREMDIIHLQKDLDATHYVKSTRYIGKEEAARELTAELGENFIDFLGYNPLLASIEVKLHAGYANNDSISKIEKAFLAKEPVKEVSYQRNLVNLVNENVNQIGVILLLFCAFLILISITLINNTIRLSVYSKRFLIHTMRLVGATSSFIRAPFLVQSLVQGLLGGFFALILIAGVIVWAQNELLNVV
jgi:cell division transport system permease protein